MAVHAYEWIDYDDETGRVYAEGELLPVWRVTVMPRSFDASFRLENGLYASITVMPDQPPEDRVLMGLCLYDPAEMVPDVEEGFYPVLTHQDVYAGIGFDGRSVPADEAWVVDEGHRYGIVNESLLAPTGLADVRDALRAWSGLRMVDKREKANDRG